MIGAKDILLFLVQAGTAFDFVRQDDKNKHQLGPPAVDYSHPHEFFGKSNRYEQGKKEYQKQCEEHKRTIRRMDFAHPPDERIKIILTLKNGGTTSRLQ